MQSTASTVIEQTVEFTVPLLVPTVNHYKRPCRYIGRDGSLHLGFKLTKEAKAYRDAVAIFAQGRTVTPATEAERKRVRYSVRMDVYLGPGQRLDSDNVLKVGIDSLTWCGVINSDAYVHDSRAVVHKDERGNPDNPRTRYVVTRLEN